MMKASHFAGKAINIAKTTLPHALSYTMTIKYGIPHGHAVSLTLGDILDYNSKITPGTCNDRRGWKYVKRIIKSILSIMGCSTPQNAKNKLKNIMEQIELETDTEKMGIDMGEVINNVNYERMKNNPRYVNEDILRTLFL